MNSHAMLSFHQVLYIQAFVLVFLLGKFMRKVFFGQLRAAEMEVNSLLSMFVLASLFQVSPYQQFVCHAHLSTCCLSTRST